MGVTLRIDTTALFFFFFFFFVVTNILSLVPRPGNKATNAIYSPVSIEEVDFSGQSQQLLSTMLDNNTQQRIS